MTDSKLVVIDAQVNKAILDQAGEHVTMESTLDEIARVLGQPARTTAALVPAEALEPTEVVDARAPAALGRAGLALLGAANDPQSILKALDRAGISKEMLPQLMESPEWAGTVLRICQQWMYVTHIPQITAAMVKKAGLGDVAASKHLIQDLFKLMSDLDGLDEQTKALAHAAPETVIRSIDAQIEHLQSIRGDLARSSVNSEKLEVAKQVALDDLTTRKPAR